MALNAQAAASLTDKQRRQVEKALALKAAGKMIGSGQRRALKAYNAALKAVGGTPTVGIGSGNKPPKPTGQGQGQGQGLTGAAARDPSQIGNPYNGMTSAQVIADPAMLQSLLASTTGVSGDLNAILSAILPAEEFAGREQWVQNQTGGRDLVAGDESLQNVSLGIDYQDLLRIVGQALAAYGSPVGAKRDAAIEKLKGIWQDRMQVGSAENPTGVPDWAAASFANAVPDPYAMLTDPGRREKGQGLPWDLQLLASPEIHLYDPSQPLFSQGALPTSLQQLTGFQAGEQGFYRGLSAQEVLDAILPKYNEYFNRDPGSAAPNAGLTFGVDPGLGSASPFDEGYRPAYADHPIRSPLWQKTLAEGGTLEDLDPANALYGRWGVFGMPGDYTMNGNINLTNRPFGRFGNFNPLTGSGSFSLGGNGQLDLLNQFLTNEIPPQWLGGLAESGYTNWNQVPASVLQEYNPAMGLSGLIGMAAALGRPDLYWQIPWAAPFENSDAIERLIAVMNSTTAPTG